MTEGDEVQFSSLKARIAALRQQGIDSSIQSSSVFEKRNVSTSYSKQKPPLPSRPKTARGSPSFSHNSQTTLNTESDKNNSKIRRLLPPPSINHHQLQANKDNLVLVSTPIRESPPTSFHGKSSHQPSQVALCGSEESQNLVNAATKIKISSEKVKSRGDEDHINLSTDLQNIASLPKSPSLGSIKKNLARLPKPSSVNGGETVYVTPLKPKLPPRRLKKEDNKETTALTESLNESSVSITNCEHSGFKKTLESHIPNKQNLSPANPPQINHNSKPSIREIQFRGKLSNHAHNCLRCRNFSGPDNVASQYPRHSLLVTHNIIAYLASVLCDPFPSATDKARAIFTWIHYNIAYDVDAFLRNQIKCTKPEDIIVSGLAVCSGYARVFESIAAKAGLEAITIVGHGKGFGYTPTRSRDLVPPFNPNGHAWNSVRIDNGEWKLVDSCWGAGNIDGQIYTPKFSPSFFTCSNEEFGIRHFPQEVKYFFRSDGFIPSWEQYIRGLGPTDQEPLQEYGNVEDDHSISFTSIRPPQKYISLNLSDANLRFQFRKVCDHLCEVEKDSSPSLFLLCLHGPTSDQWIPFNSNGYWWWLDVPTEDLIAVQRIGCYTVNCVNSNKVESITKEEYLMMKGKCSMGFSGVCAWEVVSD
ncbi:putative transglutaminase-like superfamily protein [Erysiphe neolycopersici]|uniref:Putative transglutaminase-like superfamily protein n=1 Tax=Erysiphe neolycopersici TaxID=212602 RepID=A0A420I112_9PEZI|nr:putative transglutaminase-like superfamily protein [Erysiphe neolycopersici]